MIRGGDGPFGLLGMNEIKPFVLAFADTEGRFVGGKDDLDTGRFETEGELGEGQLAGE